MRRPSKELVDAVTVDLTRRTSVEPPRSAPSSAHVVIKEEPEDSPWKPLGAADGLRGGDVAELGSPLRQKLDRKEGSHDVKPERPKLNSVAAERAIEKLIEATKSEKRKSLTPAGMLTDETRTLERSEARPRETTIESESDMAIFDFNESSPAADAPTTTSVRPKISLASAARERRRHSSIPASAPSDSEDRKSEPSARTKSFLPPVHKRTGSGAIKTGAPAAGLAKSTAAVRSSMKEREKRAERLPSSGSRVGTGEEDTRESRAERTASRRKSMMV
jgi:hypothetical protein